MRRVLAGLAGLLLLAGCQSAQTRQDGREPTLPNSTVAVELSDFEISADPASVPAGTVTFELANVGEQEHVFSVLRTDLAPAALPTLPAGNADTSAEGIEIVDFIAEFNPGMTQTLEVDITPGDYVLICNLVNHYSLGMHSSFEVTG